MIAEVSAIARAWAEEDAARAHVERLERELVEARMHLDGAKHRVADAILNLRAACRAGRDVARATLPTMPEEQ